MRGEVPSENVQAVQVTRCPRRTDWEGELEVFVVTLPNEPAWMTRLKLVCLLSGDPVTVIECVPTVAFGATVKVITEVQVGEHVELEIEYDTPLGTPERVGVTPSVLPATKVLVIEFWVKALPEVLVTFEVPEFERE